MANSEEIRNAGPEIPAQSVSAVAAEQDEACDPATRAAPAGLQIPVVIRAWRRMRSEPSLLFTTAYLFVSFLGLWANFWFYRGFGLPILEYMQASDYLVAGLRDPAYALVLVLSSLVVVLVSAPDIYRRRHPARVAMLRRRWWWRLVFPETRWLRWRGMGLAPETGATLAVAWGALWATAGYVQDKGGLIRAGREGNPVTVVMNNGSAEAQPARLLGSSSTFVFLWWPQTRMAEAVPIESIARLQSVPTPAAKPAAAPAARR